MPKVTPKQMAAAIRKHMDHSTNEALYARCDELEVLQKAMFLDLASFAKDGATDGQITELIGFLSVMQYLAEDFSKDVAKPIKMPEFSESVERALFWFKTLDTNDLEDQERMNRKWLEGMERHSEPVVWAWVVNLLKQHDFLTCSLATEMVVNIYAVADAFCRRIAKAK